MQRLESFAIKRLFYNNPPPILQKIRKERLKEENYGSHKT